ncbi:MAG: heme-binding protein [Planctomycetes bacterium]|nr:heme-binding protein [Planctomycetota bacterium]
MEHATVAKGLLVVIGAIVFAASARSEPVASPDIVAVLRADGEFTKLVAAIEAADLTETLRGAGPFTVFAPTDEAFATLPAGLVDRLLAPEGRAALARLLLGHVALGRGASEELLRAREVRPLSGRPREVTGGPGRVLVSGVRVQRADIAAANGVVHAMDRVLLPTSPERPSPEAVLVDAIERGAPLFNAGDRKGCAALYEAAAREVLGFAGDLSAWERAQLERGLAEASAEKDVTGRAWALRRAFDRLLAGEPAGEPVEGLDDAPEFTPVAEAGMPEGFPAPGPVGRLVVKRYPAYRAARAPGGTSAFGTLFMHIKRNDISMTAPVEMTMEGADGTRVKDMAFLYATPELGRVGSDGAVVVVDLESRTVLSVGMTGPVTPGKVAAARRAIEARTAEGAAWRPAGEWRLMGYNSPMISEARRFYEVQLPVEPRPVGGRK